MGEPTTLRVVSAETKTVSGSSTQSSVIGTAGATPGADVTVRLAATTDCWLAFGANPTAAADAADAIFLPSGIVEYMDVVAGTKIAVIQNSAGGKLNIGVTQKRVL
jgi:hypothetical protein